MKNKSSLRWLWVLLYLTTLALGCSSKEAVQVEEPAAVVSQASKEGGTASAADCEKLLDRLIRYIPGYGENKRQSLIKKCSDASSAAEMSVMMRCTAKPDCESFKTCLDESKDESDQLSRERRVVSRIAELREAMAEKRWKAAQDICQLYGDGENTQFAGLCEAARRGYRDWLFAELGSQRDEIKVKADYYGRCLDLKSLAKMESVQQSEAALLLCREVETAKRVQKARTEILATLREGRGRVPYECGSAAKELEKLSSEWAVETLKVIRKECEQDLPKALVQDHVDDLSQMRDSGQTQDGFTKCFDLKRLVKSLSEEEQGKAKALCDEVEAADDLKQAMAEIDRATANKVAKVPFKCGWALNKLKGLTSSEWAKKQVGRLARACYVQVGQFVLSAHVERMRDCHFSVNKVLKGLKEYQLTDPSIDALVVQAKAKCR